MTTEVTPKQGGPLIISAAQKAKMLAILNDEQLWADTRAGKLMRNFNHLLRFSCSASLLYHDLAGFMRKGHGGSYQTKIAISKMQQWMGGRCERAVQADIRELTLGGPLPLICKLEQGGLGGRRTLYGFVLDPFALAEQQLRHSQTAPRGLKNVATRPPIQVVEGRDGDSCATDEQVEWFAAYDGEPAYGAPESALYHWMRDHCSACDLCEGRVDRAHDRHEREHQAAA